VGVVNLNFNSNSLTDKTRTVIVHGPCNRKYRQDGKKARFVEERVYFALESEYIILTCSDIDWINGMWLELPVVLFYETIHMGWELIRLFFHLLSNFDEHFFVSSVMLTIMFVTVFLFPN
jgi:hypothetical protein